jgi:hypothetical protein
MKTWGASYERGPTVAVISRNQNRREKLAGTELPDRSKDGLKSGVEKLQDLQSEISRSVSAPPRDRVLTLISQYRKASKKIDAICEKCEEIEAEYPVGWFREASVDYGLYIPGGGQRREPLLAHTHKQLDEERAKHECMLMGAFGGISASSQEKSDARWRELHRRLDDAEKLRRERCERARHKNVGDTYQMLREQEAKTVDAYHALRKEIAKEVPQSLEGHLSKMALFAAEQADGVEVEEWPDIRESMNGLPGVRKWKRFKFEVEE